MFNIGDKICLRIDRSKVGIITGIIPSVPVNRYQVFHDATNMATYFENQLVDCLDTVLPGKVRLQEYLGFYAARKLSTNSASTMFALNAGKIKFIPFQFRPLARILKAERPRILIADEVGVGKTIETGIILKEFEKRDSVKSVLIICPKDLTSKWRQEMKIRFDEAFEVLSSERLSYCLDELDMEGVWPFECRKCIVGLEMLRREETITRLETMQDLACFDMLVVDEAHHVINRSSKSHQVVEYFCETSDIAVFLSATPLQLGSGDLFSLLNLLLPEEFMDESIFTAMAEPNQYINAAIRSVRNSGAPGWNLQAADALKQVCVNEWAVKVFQHNTLLTYWITRLEENDNPMSDEERISCLRDLEALHTFSHVINRTKRKDIGEFTIREPITVLNTYTPAEQDFYDAVRSFKQSALRKRYGTRTANLIMSTIERQITSSLPAFVSLLDQFIERGLFSVSEISDDMENEYGDVDLDEEDFHVWAERLRQLAQYLPERDSKAEQLLEIIDETIRKTDAGKLLVFSFFRHTLWYLQRIIAETGARVEVITGDTSSEDRDEFRNRFRLPKEDKDAIDVLLCSEVGCEGLDYEFCSRMVNYDIPWNPMKIEQRIGRIDRFGQKSPKVQIYNFITEGTVEEKIFYRCFERLGIFSSTIGDLEGVLGDVTTELTATAFDMSLTEDQQEMRMQQLIDNTIRMAEEQRQFESESKELFLMDIESNSLQITDERSIQIRWQMQLIRSYLISKYPSTACTVIAPNRLRIRMFKPEKQVLLDEIIQMKRKRKIDRNSRQVMLLETYLGSDVQNIVLNFEENDKPCDGLTVSVTHPLMMAALEEKRSGVIYTGCRVQESSVLKRGMYIFACYEWEELGYRQEKSIHVLVIDSSDNKPVDISLNDFEKLMLDAEESEEIKEPDLEAFDRTIYQKQQAAKERLCRVNRDVINKKLSTLSRYYTKQIEKAQFNLDNSSNDRIRTMYRSRIQKLEDAWREKAGALQERQQADILVSLFAYGTIEVR